VTDAETLTAWLDAALSSPNELRDALVKLEHRRRGNLTELRLAIMDAIREIKA